jgi:hypothetical protein
MNDEGIANKARFRMTLCKGSHVATRPDVAHQQTFEWHSYRDPYEPPFTPHRRTIVVPL